MSDSSAYSTSKADKTYLDRAYALQSPSEARTFYDEWAKTYDSDLSALEYVFHRHAADAVLMNLPKSTDSTVKVLDAGCGTGLVGAALTEGLKSPGGKAGADVKLEITGVDISPGMLDVARRTGAYTAFDEVDLTKTLAYSDGTYGVVVCAGTLTRGHVGPAVLSEFVRVTRTGGVIVATVLEEIWETKGFDKEVSWLVNDEKSVESVGSDRVGVVKGSEEGGRLVVLRRI